MDSLTQIILGAGIGEVVLGKKLGNRAMMWGGIAGTIPDLDILGNNFMGELEALAFHRGISHSFFFAVTFSIILAFLVHRLYESGLYRQRYFKGSILGIGSVFLSLLGLGSVIFLQKTSGLLGILLASGILFLFYKLWKSLWSYFKKDQKAPIEVSYKEWYFFFFWTIVTHPILDCFTTYGTQLFAPFSDYRVAFNNISVVDPLYTLPFLICLIIASRFVKTDKKRSFYTWLGIGLSSAYMVLTFLNKSRVDQIFVRTLQEQGLEYTRYMTTPSILNNVLWTGTAQVGDDYYQGSYSFFDRESKFILRKIPRNEKLVDGKINDPTIKCLRWFSNDYYGFLMRNDGKIQFNDLRFGKFQPEGNNEEDYIFRFVLNNNAGEYELEKTFAGPPNEDRSRIFVQVWERMKGL